MTTKEGALDHRSTKQPTAHNDLNLFFITLCVQLPQQALQQTHLTTSMPSNTTSGLNINYRRWAPPPWLPQRPEAWQTWPGAHLSEGAHPPGTKYAHNGVPQYPGNTRCKMLGEQDPYFPMDDAKSCVALAMLIIVAFLVYTVWPIYVIKHLIKKVHISDHCMSETHADDRSLSLATTNASRPTTKPTGRRWHRQPRARARWRMSEGRADCLRGLLWIKSRQCSIYMQVNRRHNTTKAQQVTCEALMTVYAASIGGT